MSVTIADHYKSLTIPTCPKCQSTVTKLIIKGFSSQELLKYAMSPESRVVLGDTSNSNKYYCETCQSYFS